MRLVPGAVLYPGAVVMLKIVIVAGIALYLTMLVGHATTADRRLSRLRDRERSFTRNGGKAIPVGFHMAVVLFAFAGLCLLTLVDDDASRAVLHIPLNQLRYGR